MSLYGPETLLNTINNGRNSDKKNVSPDLERSLARDWQHNHLDKEPCMEYDGYCVTAPMYHVFRCTRTSERPRRVVEFLPFDRQAFRDPESKAGRGICSMPKCVGDAVAMDVTVRQAYCEMHQEKYTWNSRPCPYTIIHACPERLWRNVGMPTGEHEHCSLCRAYEGFTCEGCGYGTAAA